MITVLRFPKGYQFFDANGFPLALGKLFYFAAGTTLPQDTYSDATGVTPNPNPVLLDGSGRLSGDVNLGSTANYKEILTASSGATVAPWPVDNIPKASSAGSSVMVGASADAAGNAGLAPQPQAGQQGAFLRGDGSWATPQGVGSGLTNIGVTQTATAVALSSSTGSGAAIPSADTSNAGVMSAADKAKLNGVASGATVQQSSDWNAVSGPSQILNKPILGTAASANVPSSGNAASSQVVTGADSRLSDARQPLQHAASHASGGGDAIAITAAQVSGIPASLATQNLDNVARISVGVTDPNNKLSVSAPSVLFANNGDMRASLSKGAPSNTAAFNFQDNFSTKVQFGLLGNDDFTVSTSPDGATFKAGLVVNATSGAVTLPNTPSFSGDSGAGGSKGLVPAPNAGDAAASKFLKADGTWSVTGAAQINSDWNATSGVAQILNKPAVMAGDSGSGGVSGFVPAPPSGSAAAGDFLRADGAWAVPSGGGSFSGPLSIRDTTQSTIAAQTASKFQIVEGAIQTTDATTVNLMGIPVANGETVMVRAWVSAMLSDSSGGWFQEIYRIFRRPASGSLVTLGTNYGYNMTQKDSNVNTSASMLTNFLSSGLTDTIYVQVAGEAGKTYNWFGSALVHRLKP